MEQELRIFGERRVDRSVAFALSLVSLRSEIAQRTLDMELGRLAGPNKTGEKEFHFRPTCHLIIGSIGNEDEFLN